MKNTNLTFRFRSLNQLVIALFLFASPLAGAYAACCAGHGGVASCNKSTGHQMCKDGTASPTCTCAIPKTTKKKAKTPETTAAPATTAPATKAKPKAVKTAPAATKSTTPTTTTKPKSSWWGGKSTTTTTPSSSTSAKGCCSRHGGVASCNKAKGHQMCKDGTASPSCTCQ
ncbi:MAG: hypothetical protein P4L65_07670 [Legionella sp.]|nr:hypothetical protein [Legionella sp.]